MTRLLAVVSGGLSSPSSTRLMADQLAEATTAALVEHGERSEVVTIELRELAHEITSTLLTRVPGRALAEAIETLRRADGLVAVSPTFNASYSGLFKSFFDAVEPEVLRAVPTAIGATGGTERHSLVLDHALRPLFSYLRAVIVPTGVYAAAADWGTPAGLRDRVRRAGVELAELIARSTPRTPADPFGDAPSFAELLRT